VTIQAGPGIICICAQAQLADGMMSAHHIDYRNNATLSGGLVGDLGSSARPVNHTDLSGATANTLGSVDCVSGEEGRSNLTWLPGLAAPLDQPHRHISRSRSRVAIEVRRAGGSFNYAFGVVWRPTVYLSRY
jgi:hypothetical protein